MCIRFSTGKKKKMRANTDQGLKNCPKDTWHYASCSTCIICF